MVSCFVFQNTKNTGIDAGGNHTNNVVLETDNLNEVLFKHYIDTCRG